MLKNTILKITKSPHNSNLVKNYLISGVEVKKKLDLLVDDTEENLDMENKFGIITYDKHFKYGNKKKIPNDLNNIGEPLRILIDENIFLKYIKNIKKLIILNTKYDNFNFENKSFSELLENFTYNIICHKYSSNDLQNRTLPLPGKYNDCRELYQNCKDDNLLTKKELNLKNWYQEHLDIRKELENNIKKTLNELFSNDDEFYFQIKHPLRFSINNNIGTPIHVDSCRKKIHKRELSNYRLCENEQYIPTDENYGYVETFQDENILNINYIIHDENNENQLSISNIEYDKIGKEIGYFLKPKLNYPNEAILFHPSKYLHYKSYNHMDIYIRGDLRIIKKKNYNFDKFKLYRGPRANFSVCWCPENDIEKLEDKEIKYSVFF